MMFGSKGDFKITLSDGTEIATGENNTLELDTEKFNDSGEFTGSATMTFDLSSEPLLNDGEWHNVMYQNMDGEVTMYVDVFDRYELVQVRTHKKKRINKKWAKKYGYKEVIRTRRMKGNAITIKEEDVPYGIPASYVIGIDGLKEVE